MAALTLISHPLCPYVQRAVIALIEKSVRYERVDVDLANKPAWFKAISPLGKTPVLKVGDRAIFESAVILEYLEDTQADPLHPTDPLLRAEHRAFIEFASSVLNDIWAFTRRLMPSRSMVRRRPLPASSNSWSCGSTMAPISRAPGSRWWTRRSGQCSDISMCSIGSAILAYSLSDRRSRLGEPRWRRARQSVARWPMITNGACGRSWTHASRICRS